MKNRLWMMAVVVLAFVGCTGSKTSQEEGQCKKKADCATSCADADSYTCNSAGACVCDKVTVVDNSCDTADDCAGDCNGTKSCKGGTCYCDQIVIVDNSCDTADDCAGDCNGTKSCNGGTCHCTETVESGCEFASECADDCIAADSYTCNSAGVCVCDSTVTVELGCETVDDCAADCVGADSCDCNSEGVCVRENIVTVELGCEADDDCATGCNWADGYFCGAQDYCHCIIVTAAVGTLNVIVTPETGSYEIRDMQGNLIDSRTGSASYVLPMGDYWVEFLHMDGFVTPSPKLVTVVANGTVNAPGLYVQIAGTVTVTFNGPAASYIAHNSLAVHLVDFGVTTDTDLTVRNTDIQLSLLGPNSQGPVLGLALGTGITDAGGGFNTTASFCLQGGTSGVDNPDIEVGDVLAIPTVGGTAYEIVTSIADSNNIGCIATYDDIVTTNAPAGVVVAPTSAVQEVDPYSFIQNVRVVDLDSGSTLQGPETYASSMTKVNLGTHTAYWKTFTEDYELITFQTRHLGVLVDTNVNMPDGYTLQVTIDFTGVGYIRNMALGEDILPEDIVGGFLVGSIHTTVVNSLTVTKTAVPVSQTVVKGDRVVSLGIQLTAGLAGDILSKKLAVRAYADTQCGADFSATGDLAANTVIAHLTVLDGSDVVTGPEALTLVDIGGSVGFFDSDMDFYRAMFDDLNLTVPQGTSKNLRVRAQLLNTMSQTVCFALDVIPALDVVAEDSMANTVSAQGGPLNSQAGGKNPEITVLTQGMLNAFAEGNPDGGILIAGSTGNQASQYRFHAIREAWEITKATGMHDVVGNFDTPVSTSAISQLCIRYPDINAVIQTTCNALAGGSTTFLSPGVWVPEDSDAYLDMLVDVSSMASVGESLSGKHIRVGIQDQGNSPATFEAIGQLSASVDYFEDGDEILNQSTVNTFVVRKTKLAFAKASGLSTTVINGDNRLYGWVVMTDAAGSAGYGRQVFEVQNMTSGTLCDFKVFRGSTLLTTQVNIYDGVMEEDISAGSGVCLFSDRVVVSFNQEETESAGASQTYYLNCTILGASVNDSVLTRPLGDDDTPVVGITGASICGPGGNELCSTGNGNTGRIYDANADGSLFMEAYDFVTRSVPGRNVVWTDKSADMHLYPTISPFGEVTAGSGSYDWTNGWGLGLNELPAHVLTY